MNYEEMLRERVTQYSPELQRLRKIDLLVEELNDALTDLHEKEITAIALFRALNKHIIEIPATLKFVEELISLRRSRDRLGRQEFVEVMKKRPSYSVIPYEFENEEEETKRGWLSALRFWRRRR
jgi:hypothetical protein